MRTHARHPCPWRRERQHPRAASPGFQMGFRGRTESGMSMAPECATPVSRAPIFPYSHLGYLSRLPPEPSPKQTRDIQTLAEANRKYQISTPVSISRNTFTAPLPINRVLTSSLRQPTPLFTRPISAPGRLAPHRRCNGNKVSHVDERLVRVSMRERLGREVAS